MLLRLAVISDKVQVCELGFWLPAVLSFFKGQDLVSGPEKGKAVLCRHGEVVIAVTTDDMKPC